MVFSHLGSISGDSKQGSLHLGSPGEISLRDAHKLSWPSSVTLPEYVPIIPHWPLKEGPEPLRVSFDSVAYMVELKKEAAGGRRSG